MQLAMGLMGMTYHCVGLGMLSMLVPYYVLSQRSGIGVESLASSWDVVEWVRGLVVILFANHKANGAVTNIGHSR